MSDSLDLILARAIGAGILPEGAARPAQSARPWPVVLLTALGAWLAAVPLLVMVALLLGPFVTVGVGPYFVGVLVLSGAAVVLRSKDVPLFVEQFAVPALLVGGGTLGFGVFRDMPGSTGAAILAMVALGLALVIARPWLRVLLGAAAAALTVAALASGRLNAALGYGASEALWLPAHAGLALWLAMLWVQRAGLNNGANARHAAALESVATGWSLAVLATLALLSGSAFLASGIAGAIPSDLMGRAAGDLLMQRMQAVSVVLAVAATALAAQRWPTLRRPLNLAAVLVPAALAWFLPTLGAVLMVMAIMATTRRYAPAGAAALAAAWIIGSFYYQLQWPLATKALVLVTVGAVLGALAWFTHRRSAGDAASAAFAPPQHGGAIWLIAVGALATLAVANLAIWQKENLIAQGEPVFVELAPVDPRSLMQGDYMRLDFRLPNEVESGIGTLLTPDRPHVVARRGQRGVASLLRLHQAGSPLEAGEFLIELTPKNGRWILVTDAWFFREGDARRWEAARFGEFRVAADGKALLVGMADAQLMAIRP